MMDPLDPKMLNKTKINKIINQTITTTTNQTTNQTSTTTITNSQKNKNKAEKIKIKDKPSLTRRSLNLAHLILNHHIKSPLKTTPTPINNNTLSNQNQNQKNNQKTNYNNNQINKKLIIKSFDCRVCERIITFNSDQTTDQLPLPCNTCGTVWDSPNSFINPNHHQIISPSQSQSQSTEIKINEELLIQLEKLSLPHDQLDLFDQNPSDYLERLFKENPTEFNRCQESHQLTLSLISDLFSSLSNLTNAFRNQTKKSSSSLYNIPSLEKISRFFNSISNIPGGREILCSALDQFLFHPVPQMVSIVSNWQPHLPTTPISDEDEYIEWAWTVILLQCPILSPSSKIPQQKRLVMTARLLGLISFMPNRLHHQLIKFYGSSQEETCISQALREKVELVNVFISERINYFLQVPNGFGPPSEIISPSSSDPPLPQDLMNQLPKYMSDWSLLAASRVMTLLFESNIESRKIPIEAFYNVSIDLIAPNDLIYDFEIWETRKSKYYTLCGYPSLLSLSSKINILTYEGKRQMGMEARQALFDRIVRNSVVPPVLVLNIRRSHLIPDSLGQILLSQAELKKLIKINFVDEDGVDGGGLKKEWFLLLMRQLVGPEYGMFIHDEDTHQVWFNPASTEFGEFKLIGTILGLAIYNRVTLDIGLPSIVYRKLAGRQVSGIKDLWSLKPEVANGLKWLLEYEGEEDLEEIFHRNFVAEYDAYGTIVEVPLIPGGENILVNRKNRERYVELYCDFGLNKSIELQFNSFKEGFESITNANGFSLFQPNEIELLLIGSNYNSKFSVDELQSITTYEGFDDPQNDLTIRLFWQVVDAFSFEDQKELLRFMTGSDRIPAIGLSGLSLKITKSTASSTTSDSHNSNKKKSSIQSGNQRLPESHTCFNQLILDQFSSFNQLDLKLRLAMNESVGFSLN